MAKAENNIFKNIRMAISRGRSRLFRINTGRGWTGNKIVKNKNGSITIYDPRPFSTGTPNGFSDSVGWLTVTITPELVGQELAIFLAIEVKTPTGRVSKDQQNFLDRVEEAGGIAGVARSAEDALELLDTSRNRG